MKHLLKLLLLGAMLTSYGSKAEDKTASVLRLLEAMNIEYQLAGSFEAMVPMIDQISANLALNALQREELLGIYREWFENDIDRKRLLEDFAAIYSGVFNQQELDQMIEFYTSPVGQKFIEKSPVLMEQGVQIGMEMAQRAQPQLLERLQPFLEKHKAQQN